MHTYVNLKYIYRRNLGNVKAIGEIGKQRKWCKLKIIMINVW